jgi:hypothetical protein
MCLIKYHTWNKNLVTAVQIYIFLSSSLDVDMRSVSRAGNFI